MNYSASVTNNDNAGCGASAFKLESTLPVGWSGSFANPAMSLMPGTAATTTLTVTSAAGASAGTYPVGVRATNGSSATHSGAANSSYVVAGALATTVATNKAMYRRNENVAMTASVSSSGVPVANASVAFTIVKPNGATVVQNASTNASGVASATYRVTRADPVGTWQLRNNSSHLGSSASASSSFAVQ